MEPDDATLVLGCQRGEEASWDLLVTRYQRLIYSIARRGGLDQEQATEVYQRVFTILIERLDSIKQPALIGAWLATTTRHESWRIRRRERTQALGADRLDAAEAQPDSQLAPPDLILRLEQQQRIRIAVASLDERCQRLISLLFYRPDPLPYAEIAALLGTREGSIGPIRARCLQKLRRLLEDSD